MVIIKMVRGIQKHFPARASEWALGVMLFYWGLILLGPSAVFDKSATYAGLANIAPEESWGLACMLVGGARLLALFINGTFAHTRYGKHSPHVRGVMAFVSCFFWLQISVGMIRPDGATTGLAIYPVLLALDMWNAMRAWHDAGQVDGIKDNGGT